MEVSLKDAFRLFFRKGHMIEDILTNVSVIFLTWLTILMAITTAISLH